MVILQKALFCSIFLAGDGDRFRFFLFHFSKFLSLHIGSLIIGSKLITQKTPKKFVIGNVLLPTSSKI